MQEVFEKILERLEERIENNKKYLTTQLFRDTNNQIIAYKKAISIVQEVSEEYNNSWIPCSERLPSDCEIHEVTAQFRNGKVYTEFAYYDETKEEWWKHDNDGLVNAIAWKEPSEPYQPKGE